MSKAAAANTRTPFGTRVIADIIDVAISPNPSAVILAKVSSAIVAQCATILATRRATESPDITDAEQLALWHAYFAEMEAVAATPATTPEALAAKASLILADFEENPPSTSEEAVAESLARDLIRVAGAQEAR